MKTDDNGLLTLGNFPHGGSIGDSIYLYASKEGFADGFIEYSIVYVSPLGTTNVPMKEIPEGSIKIYGTLTDENYGFPFISYIVNFKDTNNTTYEASVFPDGTYTAYIAPGACTISLKGNVVTSWPKDSIKPANGTYTEDTEVNVTLSAANTYTFNISDKDDGTPIDGVTGKIIFNNVEQKSAFPQSDATGKLDFNNLPVGGGEKFTFVFSKPGYKTSKIDITVPHTGDPTTFDVELQKLSFLENVADGVSNLLNGIASSFGL